MPRLPITIILLLLILAAPALADNPRNAATWYRRAFEAMDAMDESDWAYIAEHASGVDEPPAVTPALRDVVRAGRRTIDLAVRGSRQPRADFGLEYDDGIEMELPHLGRLRRIVLLMRADAVVRLADGRPRRAADLVEAAYRIAGHLRADRTMVSSLIAERLLRSMDRLVKEGIDSGAFSAVDSARMLRPLRGLEPRDPFGIVDAIAMEGEFVAGWLDRRFRETNDPAQLAEDLELLTGNEDDAEAIAGLDEATFGEELDAYDGMMNEVAAIMADEDEANTAAELKRVTDEIAAGEHGSLSPIVTTAFDFIWRILLETRDQVKDRVTLLDAHARGDIDPADETNAAVLYRRAIATFEGLDDRFRIRGVADDRAPEDLEATRALLAEAAGVLDVVVEGAARDRCDFTFARGADSVAIAEPYVPGMRDLLRLLLADARVRLSRGDAAGARERLVTTVAVIAHLARDETLMAALVAHRSFERVLVLLDELEAAGALTAEMKAGLGAPLRRIGRGDPFGYAGGLAHARARIARWLERDGMRRVEDRAKVAAAVSAVDRLDADRVLHLLAVASAVSAEGDGAAIDGLHDVIDLAALAAVRESSPAAATAFSEGRLDIFGTTDVAALAGAAKAAARARPDLRRATTMVRSLES